MDTIKLNVTGTIEFTFDQISCVYVGKPNTCMCGCAGKYTYTALNREWGGKNRGYIVDDDEVNDARVKRVLKKFMKAEMPAEMIDGFIFTKVIGKTQYTIYLKKVKEETKGEAE